LGPKSVTSTRAAADARGENGTSATTSARVLAMVTTAAMVRVIVASGRFR
jgi:hypothetical protein